MNIPQIQNLVSQTFNSNFIEFVWQFSSPTNQIIFKILKDGSILLMEGESELSSYLTSGIISTKNISVKDLILLKDEVVSELKSL